MPITSDVIVAGSVRWLSSTYPRQVSSLERLLFGTATFKGMAEADVIDARAAQVPADTASDGLCQSLVADATLQTLNGIIAKILEPVAPTDGVAALSAAIVNPVLEPNLAGQGRPIQPPPPAHPRPAEGSPIKEETIDAIKQGAQRAIRAAFPEKAAMAMNLLLFGGFGITGLIDNGQIAAAAFQGNVVTPEDATDLMAMSLVTTATEGVLKALLVKAGIVALEGGEDAAGLAGMIVIGVFKVTPLAGPQLDQTHPAGGLITSPQQGSSATHQPGEGHDNSNHPTPAGGGGNTNPAPAGPSAPAGNQGQPAPRPAPQPAGPPIRQTDSGHNNGGNGGGGDGRMAGGGEGDDRGGGHTAKKP